MKKLIAAAILGMASLSANAACLIRVDADTVINVDNLLYYSAGMRQVDFVFTDYKYVSVSAALPKQYMANFAKVVEQTCKDKK